MRGEGHSAAGWGIGRPVIAADCGVQSLFIRAMGCRYLRCAIYCQCWSVHHFNCKPLLVTKMILKQSNWTNITYLQ